MSGGLLAVKLRRDVRATWPQFAMMVLAIAVSLTAFASVLFAWGASGRESTGAYASTEPASATLLFDRPVSADKMTSIVAEARDQSGVLAASGRTQFNSEIEVNGTIKAIPLQTFVATEDDEMDVARFFIRQSSWPPKASEIYIAQDSLALLDMAVGDTVTVQAPTGEPVRLRVADTVYDPSLSPSPQEQTGRAYVSAAALPGIGGQAALDQLKLQIADPEAIVPSGERDRIGAVASDVAERLARDHSITVREIQVPEPYEHPHQWQADALLGALLAGGAAALLLSTILVANMLNNLFTQQIPQIGIMKAVGARAGRVGRHYLIRTLLIAAVATLIAVPPAVLLGRLAVSNFLGFLGIQPVSLAAPWWTYLAVVGVGLGMPPLMALLPLVRASRTTVRAAIDHHGGSARPHALGGLLTRLSQASRLNRGVLMALRNTVRRPARFLLSVGLLASAGMVFVAGMSLSSGVEAIDEEQQRQTTWDIDARLASPAPIGEVRSRLRQVPHVAEIDGYTVAQTGLAGPGSVPLTRTYPDQGHGRATLTAIPDDSPTFTRPELLDGRWLRRGETGAVVLNQITIANSDLDVDTGDTVQLILDEKSTNWEVIGIVEERQGGSGGVYTTAEGYAEATGQPGHVNTLRVTTTSHDEATRTYVADTIDTALTDAGIKVSAATSISRSEAISGGHLGPIVLILLGIAMPLGVVGLIGLGSTMSANVLDRTREFGVMHAIGARPKTVRHIVVAEGLFLAAMSCLAAVFPALGLTAILGDGLGNLFFSAPLPYRVSLIAVAIWAVLVILGAALATDAAATRASKITVREALAHL